MRWAAIPLTLLMAVACSETSVSKVDGDGKPGSSSGSGGDNTAPEADVLLRPVNPRTNDTVTAVAEATDADNDSITLSYAFTVDGVTVQDGPDTTLSGGEHFNKGQAIQVIVSASDGADSTTAESNTVVVANTPPTAPMVSILPTLACPADWTEMADGERCVQVFADGISTWQEAQTECNTMGGDLARISDADENEQITTMAAEAGMPGEHFWIGYNDLDTEGDWTWADGGPVTYENWRPGEPAGDDDDYSHCGTIYFIESMWGLWNDFWCDPPYGQGGYACQVEKTEADITCIIDEPSNDEDFDAIDYTVAWDVNETPFTDTEATTYDADTVPGDALGFDEIWTCSVTPNDGDENGPAGTATYAPEACPETWFSEDFNGESPTELRYNGDAYHNETSQSLQLAGGGVTYDNNVVYLKEHIPADMFYVSFDSSMSGPGDGVALIFSNDTDPTAHQPDQPYGVAGLNGYIVIFDIFHNATDPGSGDFVAVYQITEAWPHEMLVWDTSVPNLNDGVNHTFEVFVDAGRIQVAIDGTDYIDYDLPSYPYDEVMLGWGAHNGVMTSNTTVDNIVVACRKPGGE
jgi:hypothetical protein